MTEGWALEAIRWRPDGPFGLPVYLMADGGWTPKVTDARLFAEAKDATGQVLGLKLPGNGSYSVRPVFATNMPEGGVVHG